jgi:aldehyde dehydrogenase (NAD+)
MPFGGVGNSGMGKYHGRAGYECFTTDKAVAYQNVANPMRTAFHPPYTKEKEQYLESMLPKV